MIYSQLQRQRLAGGLDSDADLQESHSGFESGAGLEGSLGSFVNAKYVFSR